jgi:hypothetical protein
MFENLEFFIDKNNFHSFVSDISDLNQKLDLLMYYKKILFLSVEDKYGLSFLDDLYN